MTNEQLRLALQELHADRDVELAFAEVAGAELSGVNHLYIKKAFLVPEENDNLVKLTDGKHIYIVDAERVAWVKIG